MSGRAARQREESGQTSLLIVGFAVVVALLVAVVVNASAAYLRRQGLDSLADGAALAAADGVQGEQVYVGGLGERARIDAEAARRYVAAYLRSLDVAADYPGLSYRVETSVNRVVVRVSAPLELPFAAPGWDDSTTVTSTAAAYVAVTR